MPAAIPVDWEKSIQPRMNSWPESGKRSPGNSSTPGGVWSKGLSSEFMRGCSSFNFPKNNWRAWLLKSVLQSE